MSRNSRNDMVDLSSMRTRGRRKKRNTFRIVMNIICSIVLVLSTLATTGILALGMRPLGNGGDNQSETNSELEPLTYSAHKNSSYILIVGVDNSENLTDVIMVACIDHEKDTMNILQIPRDTFIDTNTPSGKINAVYGHAKKGENKINALRRKLSSHLGIPLDHYVTFTLAGFRNVVDAVGGVTINITQPRGIDVEDFTTGDHYIMGPGEVLLDGHKAESFVRKRYQTKHMDPGYELGDISRVQQQRIFYAALAQKLKSMSMSQVTKIATTCYDQIQTSMSVGEMLGYAKELMSVNLDNVVIKSVPGQFCNYKGVSYYSIHKKDYVEMYNQYFNPYGDTITTDGIKIRELHTAIGEKYEPSVANDGGTLGEIHQQNQ
ncbi:MAG: LCP family protein [Clostridiales bacterium]|nr:LCP family protein [Clostridiales bacterium]